jgi:chromosome segregation ATPase
MLAETMSRGAQPIAVPDGGTQARRWASLPAPVREKFERLEVEAAQLRAASRAATNAWMEARDRHERAVDDLQRFKSEAARHDRHEGTVSDLEGRRLEIQQLAERADRLQAASAPIEKRAAATVQLLAACRKYLDVEGWR